VRAPLTNPKVEFGDFQTPRDLARAVAGVLAEARLEPASLLEPTCGEGHLLAAGIDALPTLIRAVGLELDADYVARARRSLRATRGGVDWQIEQADFFDTDWKAILGSLPDPLLILGNPPWVTNAALGALGGTNLPPKSNAPGLRGLDALTGRSNFDISEWMLLQCLGWTKGRDATLAMLCKTQVARRVLERVWKDGAQIGRARMYAIDALAHFGASVDACLLVVSTTTGRPSPECAVHPALDAPERRAFGLRQGQLASDLAAFERWQHLTGESPSRYRWRSGVKHDAAAVMELRGSSEASGGLANGLGEAVDIEPEHVFALRKSSWLGSERVPAENRYVVLPQRAVGEDTAALAEAAPRTWAYLCRHAERLDARKSRIYRGRPRFSIFGVGPYTFAPWKVAISGLYKRLRFRLVGPEGGRPVVFDDTCYALACESEAEAQLVLELLESAPAQEFYRARVFWDAKRPITAGLLGRLDLGKLADELGRGDELRGFARAADSAG